MADEESTQETKPHQVPDDLGEPGATDEASETQGDNGGEKRRFFKRRSRERDEEEAAAAAEDEAPQAGYEPVAEPEPEPEPEPEAEPEPEVVEVEPAAAPVTEEPPPESPAGADARSETPVWAAELPDSKAVERPELFVAGAFVGGFVLAKLLGKLGGGDE